MSLVIRADAARDMSALVAAVPGARPHTAAKLSAALTRTVDGLERFPLLGSELGPSADGSAVFRFTTVRRFPHLVVIDLPLPDGVDVVRVADGRRDLARLIAAITP